MKKQLIFLLLLTISFNVKSQNNDQEYFEIAKNLTIFNEVYKNVNIYFVDETNPGELMKTGIDAMLTSLDPYTNYIPESRIEDQRIIQTGQYGGIGALIKKQGDYIVISEPYDNFPAQKAGLKAGDKIIEIDGQSLKDKSSSEVSELLKGTAGTDINILVERYNQNQRLEKKVTREVIKIPSVPHYDMLNESTGYIKLTSFTSTASQEVGEAFEKLKDSNNLKSLVLDLRGNGGGLLNEAVEIVNFFVEKGVTVVEMKGRLKENNQVYRTKSSPKDTDIPLVVLIDGGSASASEIVSGGLQDLDRAVIIGQQSFGKGLVQQYKKMDYNTQIKVTIAKYYTPSGRCIQRLDYSDRNISGEGNSISDSLISYFKTKNGRKVRDGRGIDPDIEIEEKKYSALAQELVIEDFIFDFATQFYYENDTIDLPQNYVLSDKTYNDFKQFVLDKDFEYKTYSSETINGLIETTKEEGFYDDFQKEIDLLKEKLAPNKERDLNKFKEQIKELLTNEIVSRYYYQKGRVKVTLKNDPFIQESLKILGDQSAYDKELMP